MNIEVIVQGKGSITVTSKVEAGPKKVEKLTSHFVELLADTVKRPGFGFASGSGGDAERADSSVPAELPTVDREAWGRG